MSNTLAALEPTFGLWLSTGLFGFLAVAFLLLRLCTSAVRLRLVARAQSGDREAQDLLCSWSAARQSMISNVTFAAICGTAAALLAMQTFELTEEQLLQVAYVSLGLSGLQVLFLLGALLGSVHASSVSKR